MPAFSSASVNVLRQSWCPESATSKRKVPVAQESLDRNAWLAPSFERFRGFVTATATNLHRFIRNPPRRLGRPHFAHGGFDSQIPRLAIDQWCKQVQIAAGRK